MTALFLHAEMPPKTPSPDAKRKEIASGDGKTPVVPKGSFRKKKGKKKIEDEEEEVTTRL